MTSDESRLEPVLILVSANAAEEIKSLQAEQKRLKVKYSEISDKDIRSALKLRMDAIDELLAQAGKSPIPEEAKPEEVLPEPPTPAQKDEADRLIQQARVEKLRKNTTASTTLLKKAAEVAPGSSQVLEMVGDELVEQKRFNDALKNYALAKKIDPKNLSVDKKHAELIFQTKAQAASLDLASQTEQLASNAKLATVFSVLVPGAGQLVLSQYFAGAFFLGGYALMALWVYIQMPDLLGILVQLGVHTKGTVNTHPNYSVLIPVFIALILHLTSIFTCASQDKVITKKEKIPRPAPPVNLPFD